MLDPCTVVGTPLSFYSAIQLPAVLGEGRVPVNIRTYWDMNLTIIQRAERHDKA